MNAARPILTRRQLGWLAAAFGVVVVYGSLVPFDFRYVPFDVAVEQYRGVLSAPVRIESRSDWAANVLLFIPLGFLWMAALAADRPRAAGWWAALVFPACVLFSLAVEFTQLYFPPRDASLNDVVAESTGGAIGIAIWLAVGQPLIGWLRRRWQALGEGSAAPLLTAYIAALVVVHALPLDLTLSPADLYRKYRDHGRVLLVPFVSGNLNGWERTQKILTNVAYFLPVGLLLYWLNPPRWQDAGRWLRVLACGLGLAALIEFMQLFVMTRTCDTTDVITGGFAVLAGWLIARAQRDRARRPLAWVLWLWLAILVFINWQPFAFDFSIDTAAGRFEAISLVPFEDYYQQNYLHAFDEIASKVFVFVPLGVLLALAFAWAERRYAIPLVVALAVGITAILEAGQLFLPGRYASVTDVIIETFGVWLGFILGRRLRLSTRP